MSSDAKGIERMRLWRRLAPSATRELGNVVSSAVGLSVASLKDRTVLEHKRIEKD